MRMMIAVAVTLVAVVAFAQSDDLLDTYMDSYEKQHQAIQHNYVRALDTIEGNSKKKGDLDPILIIREEKKRFSEAKTVLPLTDANESFRPAVLTYCRETDVLLSRYVKALNALIKKHVTADRIEQATLVREEKDKAMALLAEVQAQLPAKMETGSKLKTKKADNLKHPEDAEQFEEHWYEVFNEVVPWDDAKKRCEEMGGYLACVTSKDENVFVAELAGGRSMWLGASDAKREGRWRWVTREPFRYNKWFPGQPANDGGNSHYLHIGVPWMNAPADWNDGPLVYPTVVGFVCEWEQ